MKRTTCKSCGAPIFWAKTVNGKPMPLDAEPVLDGRIILEGQTAIVVGSAYVRDGTARYDSHFATCPNARSHRRARR